MTYLFALSARAAFIATPEMIAAPERRALRH
jgi:hypothetical protein